MNVQVFLIQTVIPILIGVLLVAGVMYLLVTNPFEGEAHPVLAASYKQYSAAAEVHKGRVGSYDGFCEDLAIESNVTCVSDWEHYVIYEFISDLEGYYCADSQGYRGTVVTVSTNIQCQL